MISISSQTVSLLPPQYSFTIRDVSRPLKNPPTSNKRLFRNTADTPERISSEFKLPSAVRPAVNERMYSTT